MKKYFNIGFIGSGNLAWHLAPSLENSGHRVSLVYSRNKKHTKTLIGRLYNAAIKKNLDFSNDDLDILIIAVRDSNIIDISSEIIVPDHCILIHTSGSQSIEVLERSACQHLGVLYPLQSFTIGHKVDIREVPCFIEANTGYAMELLKAVTQDLTKHVHVLNSNQRRALHLSAVFASNFSNHMLVIAEGIMRNHDLNFSSLQTVVQKTIEKAFSMGPVSAQTGPAARQDHETMDIHAGLLKNREDLLDLYLMISNHIIQSRTNK